MSDICGAGISSPLVPDDAGYLGFFSRVMECLEEGAEKIRVLVEVKRRDLLARAASNVFSHLLHLDPHFDFEAVLGPVPEVTRAALAEWVKDHVEDLIVELSSDKAEGHAGARKHEAAGSGDGESGGDYVSP